MKVSGFTIIRNAIKFDFPVVEAIRSILPICDEFVVAVGNSGDETESLIRSIDPKIRIINTLWDDSLREGGKVLAEETNKAFDAISPDSDWAFYIQADECVHEKYLPAISDAMHKWKSSPEVEGLLFSYLHFYATFDYLADSRKWYRKEIRIIKNDKSIRSWKDAQGFRKNGNKLHVKEIDAFIYHYGWVKDPSHMMEKQKSVQKFWHDDKWIEKNVPKQMEFDYSNIDSLKKFNGSHPEVMSERIKKLNWKFDRDPSSKKFSLKIRFLYWLENFTGWRVGEYKNYRKI